MAKKTSINIKPCNVRSSGPHNRRTAEYLANIRKEKIYVRTDLMAKNEEWVAPELGETTLEERNRQIAAMVKEKTGRAMQTKDREKVNKKTGKVTIVRGSTPIKEGGCRNQGRHHDEAAAAFLRDVQGTLGNHTTANIHPPGRGALRQSR